MPDRRAFLLSLGAAAATPWLASRSAAYPRLDGSRVLILVELRGGNDALNTVVPFADAAYYALRPSLALPRATALPLDATTGLHPALRPLMPLWQAGELGVVRNVGYLGASLSHMRSIAVWDTAATEGGYAGGWLARALEQTAGARGIAMDGAPGPLAGCAGSADALPPCTRTGAHGDDGFLQALRDAARLAAMPVGAAAIKVSLRGFDTHAMQAPAHARLLDVLARGLSALAADLRQSGRWGSALVLTYSEFGRRAAENGEGGTDHGTGGIQIVFGGAVRGGLYGASPPLDVLDPAGGIPCEVDFRRVYAAVLEQWWGLPSAPVLGGHYEALPLIMG